jgi:hypothetical protein
VSRRRIEDHGSLRPLLATFLRARRRDESTALTVEAFASAVSRSKQTLHTHDKRVERREQVLFRIHRARERRAAIFARRRSSAPLSKRSRAGDAERIARLAAELDKWKTWYHNLLDRHLILEEAARRQGWHVDALYAAGLNPPDRSTSKGGSSGTIVAIERGRGR